MTECAMVAVASDSSMRWLGLR